MNYRVQLLRGYREPSYVSYQLQRAETITGIWNRIALFVICWGVLYGLSTYLGLGTEQLSKEMASIAPAQFELQKLLFTGGRFAQGMITAVIFIFLPSLFFWAITSIEYKKLLAIQLFLIVMLTIEKIINVPIFLLLGLTEQSSPFSLGIIAQYISTNEFIIRLLSGISIFKIAIIVCQYYFVKALSDTKGKLLFFYVIAINVLLLLLTVVFVYIPVEKLL